MQYSLSEGFCNAVLEAQAMGCLCIVSDGGALPENVVHEKSGWVVPKQQPELLAKKLIEIIHMNDKEKHKISKFARQRVIEHFNLKDQAKAFKGFYE